MKATVFVVVMLILTAALLSAWAWCSVDKPFAAAVRAALGV